VGRHFRSYGSVSLCFPSIASPPWRVSIMGTGVPASIATTRSRHVYKGRLGYVFNNWGSLAMLAAMRLAW
jgi:hypothetical protein